jgi:hypothetical protein
LQWFFLSLPFFSMCSLFSLGFLVVDSVAWAWWFGLADLGVVVLAGWVFWVLPVGFSVDFRLGLGFCRLGLIGFCRLGLGSRHGGG